MKFHEQLGLESEDELEFLKIKVRRQYERQQRHRELIKRDRLELSPPTPEPVKRPSKTLRELQDQINSLEKRVLRELAIMREQMNTRIRQNKKSRGPGW